MKNYSEIVSYVGDSPKPIAIRFHSSTQIELVKAAARNRGLSFNAFVVRILEGVAKRALDMPAEPALGEIFNAAPSSDISPPGS